MNQLLSKARINDDELKSILNRIQGELLKLSKPGYCPKLGEFDLNLLEASGLTKQDIEDFAERTWKGRPEEKFKTVSDPFRLFLVWLMWYYLTQKDAPGFRSTLICHMIRQYRNLFKNLYFKISCNPYVSILALDRLSKSHLFSREGSIPNAISYLSNELGRKYEQGIRNWNVDAIAKFIRESNRRLNQSLKSFARTYYKIDSALGQQRIVPDEERDDQVNPSIPNRREELSHYVASRICMGAYKDQQAIDEAKKITKISDTMATALVDELSNGTTSARYFNSFQDILTLLLASPLSAPTSSGIDDIVTRLMSIKRTTKPVHFKKEIQNLTSVLVENSGHQQEFRSLTSQTQFRISQFLAYYIARVLKTIVLQLKESGSP